MAQPQSSQQAPVAPNPRAAPFTPGSFAPTPSEAPPAMRPAFSAAAPSFTPGGAGATPLGVPGQAGTQPLHRATSMNASLAAAPPFVPKGLGYTQQPGSAPMAPSMSMPSPGLPAGLQIPHSQVPPGHVSPISATSPGFRPQLHLSPLPGPQYHPGGPTSPLSMPSPHAYSGGMQGNGPGSGHVTPRGHPGQQPLFPPRSNSIGPLGFQAANVGAGPASAPPMSDMGTPGISSAGASSLMRPQRKTRGGPPPTHTPLKTTGHNHKPSVSLAPAAFAAALAEQNANKPKRKVVVSLPKESGRDEDPDDARQKAEQDAKADGKDEETVLRKGRQAAAAVLVRKAWTQRDPVPALDFINSIYSILQDNDLRTAGIYPEPWPYADGLPDTIDIYLPGQASWQDYKEIREEERRQEEAQKQLARTTQQSHERDPSGLSEAAIENQELEPSAMSSPADPTMVSSRLEKYLTDQKSHNGDDRSQAEEEEPTADSQPTGLVSSDPPPRADGDLKSFRFGNGNTPSRGLTSPPVSSMARRAPETPTRNEKTMSLSMPSSGGPFASAALMAMGLPSPAGADEDDHRGAHSDGEMASGSSSFRDKVPVLARSDSAPGRSALRVSASSAASSSSPHKSADHSSKPSWKDLGAGFGYELEDVAEESPSAVHSRDPSRQHDLLPNDEIEDDLRTNPSEDADASEVDDTEEANASHTWGPTINFDDSIDQEEQAHDEREDDAQEQDFGEYTESSSESDQAEYSNPSDEEEARVEREERRALRAERRAGRAIAQARARDNGLAVGHHLSLHQGRPRANTADTFASSSLHPEGEYGPDPHHAQAGGDHERTQRSQGMGRWSLQRARDAEINSNPSDDEDEDGDPDATAEGGATFGNRYNGPIDGPNSPQDDHKHSVDYRFPTAASGTIGRSAAGRVASGLNPAAKEFVFGASASTNGVSEQSRHVGHQNAGPDHFRLPSIPNSSFGGSAFAQEVEASEHPSQTQQRQVSAGGTILNATAPAFNPRSAFTFAAPSGAPRLPQSFVAGEEEGLREEQGREKRSRIRDIDGGESGVLEANGVNHGEVGHAASDSWNAHQRGPPRSNSPDRPGPSQASVEGGLREYTGDAAVSRPPPFNSRGLPPYFAPPATQENGPSTSDTRSRQPSGSASLRPSAPSFMPTWAKSLNNQGTRQARPGIPSFEGPQDVDGIEGPNGAQVPTSDFTFTLESKAIPIRAPQDEEEVSAAGGEDEQENQPRKGSLARAAGKALADKSARRRPLTLMASEAPRGAIDIPGTSPTHSSLAGTAGGSHGTPPRRPSRLSREHRLSREYRSSRSSTGDRDGSSDGSDAESETFQDIIDELARRMDQSLDAWGGRILDEVTLAGQVRPVVGGPADARSAARLSDDDRVTLVASLVDAVKTVMSKQLSDLQTDLIQQQSRLAIAPVSTERDGDSQSLAPLVPPKGRRSGHRELDAQGELDFDYVTDVIDQKVSNLKRDVLAAFDTALPRAMERLPDAQPLAGSSPSADKLADAVLGRLLPFFEKTRDALAERQRAELSEVLDPLLRNTLSKAVVATENQRDAATSSLVQTIEGKIHTWEKILAEMQKHLPEYVQVALINGIIPHLDSFVTKQEPQVHIAGSDPDVVAARVTEILAPMISDSREARRERQRSDEREREQEREREMQAREQALDAAITAVRATGDTLAKQGAANPEEVSTALLEKILPIVSSIKTEPIDTQELISKISEVVGKQSIEHLVDLDPVTALLEPLVAKQDDVRSLSQKLLSRQREIESALSDMPTLVGAKVEALYSAHRDVGDGPTSQDASVEVKSLLQELLSKVDGLNSRSETGLEQARREAMEHKTEASEIRAELIAAGSYSSALKDEVTRLEKSADDLFEQIRLLRGREADANSKAHTAESQAAEATYQLKDLEASRDEANTRCTLLQSHCDQLANELKESREERARERESAAQATAEVMARLVSAERAVADAHQRTAERDQAERDAREKTDAALREALDRAARAEGEMSALQKRIADQDSKLATLQTVNATQKQKAAEAQQKLSEASKQREQYETQSQEHAVALARLKDIEERLVDKDSLQERLHSAEEAKMQLREELSQYHDRFLDLERDLVGMKERLVGREELDACQEDLAASREETARLRGQLAERDRLDAQRQAEEQQRAAQQGIGRSPGRYDSVTPKPGQPPHAWEEPPNSDQSMSASQSLSHSQTDGRRGFNSTWTSVGDDETDPSSPTTAGGYTVLRRSSSSGGDYKGNGPVQAPRAPSIVVSRAPSVSSTHAGTAKRAIQKTDDGWWS